MDSTQVMKACSLGKCIHRTCEWEVKRGDGFPEEKTKEHEAKAHGIVRCPDCVEMASIAEESTLNIESKPSYLQYTMTVPRLSLTWFSIIGLLDRTIENHFLTHHFQLNKTLEEKLNKIEIVRKALLECSK